jgi:hypothetical protein
LFVSGPWIYPVDQVGVGVCENKGASDSDDGSGRRDVGKQLARIDDDDDDDKGIVR